MKKNKIMKYIKITFIIVLISGIILSSMYFNGTKVEASEDTITLRVANWEEYIDEGDWGEEDEIDLDSETIFSENGLISDFEDWYYTTYGQKVEVEYSNFGTNEDLYSQLILGDTFDLVCPSDYMIMKMMNEDMLQPLSDDFFKLENENNYYIKGISPYIENVFNENEINGEAWSRYAAGYMWGTIGMVYNPEEVTEAEASTWSILTNPKFARQVTMKDSVRESYFSALGILYQEKFLSEEFVGSDDYQDQLTEMMNDVSQGTIDQAEEILQEMRENVYSFEVDSGKADMVTGKVVANLQWSGDAVYTMDLAEEEDVLLNYAVPKETTNLWFDGWVMLKSGIEENSEKQQAAEAFINFLSRPDNVVRNMYYIGYTSVISGGDNDLVYEYLNWCYGAEDEADVMEYPVGYFFSGDNEDTDYIITTYTDQSQRQLFAQYPTIQVINRSVVMGYFNEESNTSINQMWINVRCFNLDQVSMGTWVKVFFGIGIIIIIIMVIIKRHSIFKKPKKKSYIRIS